MEWSIFRVIVFFILFYPVFSFSQNHDTPYLGLKDFVSTEDDKSNLLFFCRKSNEKRKPVSQVEWKDSNLLTTTNETIALKARYLSNEDVIEALIGNDIYILFQEKTQAISIGNQVFIKSKYSYKDQLYFGYFEIISEGNVLLLKREGNYYFKKKNQSVQKFKPTKKALCQIFENQSKKVKTYTHEKKLNLKNESDLNQLFSYVNQQLNLEK